MKGFGGKYLEKKKFSKKNDINKSKNSSRLNNLEKNKFDNINAISEFKLDNEQKDNKTKQQKEEIKKKEHNRKKKENIQILRKEKINMKKKSPQNFGLSKKIRNILTSTSQMILLV